MGILRPRKTGERKHKSVRGCIVDASLSVLNLVIVKKGEKDIPGLTDTTVLCQWDLKELVESKSFLISPKKIMSASVIRKSLKQRK